MLPLLMLSTVAPFEVGRLMVLTVAVVALGGPDWLACHAVGVARVGAALLERDVHGGYLVVSVQAAAEVVARGVDLDAAVVMGARSFILLLVHALVLVLLIATHVRRLQGLARLQTAARPSVLAHPDRRRARCMAGPSRRSLLVLGSSRVAPVFTRCFVAGQLAYVQVSRFGLQLLAADRVQNARALVPRVVRCRSLSARHVFVGLGFTKLHDRDRL